MPSTPKEPPRALIASLWIVVLLNILFRDIHQFLAPGFLDEVRAGVIDGTPLNPDLLIAGALLLQLPFLMIVLAQVLAPPALRVWNTVAGVIMGAGLLAVPPGDTDDWVHLVSELAALSVLLWCLWRPVPKRRAAVRP